MSAQDAQGKASSEGYILPVDKSERERLDTQHEMWKGFFGGNGLYPVEADEIVRSILAPNNASEPPKILDLGSGSGIWAVKTAELFSGATVLGIDQRESTPDPVPSNCSFISKDMQTNMEEYKESFNLVHARGVTGFLVDTTAFIQMMCDCLKPGGILFLLDGNPNTWDADHRAITPASLEPGADNTDKSWLALLLQTFLKVIESKLGPRVTFGKTLDDLIPKEPRLQATGRKTYYDLLNCAEGDSDLSKSSAWSFANTMKPVVLGSGMAPETMDKIFENIALECRSPKKFYSRWDVVWAVRKN